MLLGPAGVYELNPYWPFLVRQLYSTTSFGAEHHAGTGVVLDRVVLDRPVGARVVVDDPLVVVATGLTEVLDRQVLDRHVRSRAG